MKQKPRIYYSDAQKALMWDRWQKGNSMHAIARLFDRGHASVQHILAETGGIAASECLSHSLRQLLSRATHHDSLRNRFAETIPSAPNPIHGRSDTPRARGSSNQLTTPPIHPTSSRVSGSSLRAHAEIPDIALQQAFTPEATRSHVPIPHHGLVDLVRYALTYHGHEVTEEHHGLTADGMRYFGIFSLKSKYGDYTDTVGLRNSHDKRFPIGISMCARVFVCDNLSFMGEHVIKRKHTANAKRELPGLVMEIVEPLADARRA